MALVPIDPELNKSEEVANFLLFMINEDRDILPKLSIPQIIAAKTRPGLNSEVLTSSIVSRFEEAGIPTGPLIGGAPNVMEALVKIIVEETIAAIQSDMRVDLIVDAGVTVNTLGANAGGPVNSVGASIQPHTGVGVPR